jgi:hypothetical protein
VARHVFVSYGRDDHAYAQRLSASLEAAGIPVWYDHAMVSGDRFDEVIQEKLDGSSAVIVLLSPAAVASQWVKREISYALNKAKPVLPLLVTPCDIPILLIDRHHEDVTDGRLPGPSFMDRIRTAAGVSERSDPKPSVPVTAGTPAQPISATAVLRTDKRLVLEVVLGDDIHVVDYRVGIWVDRLFVDGTEIKYGWTATEGNFTIMTGGRAVPATLAVSLRGAGTSLRGATLTVDGVVIYPR